jgi:hypothetical protein
MLDGKLGIRVMIRTGRSVPTRRPEVAAAFRSISVTNDADGTDGFQLSCALTKSLGGQWDLLKTGALEPMNRVILAVYIGLTPSVLIDGIITTRHIRPARETGASTVWVTGSDLTVKLDLEEKSHGFPNQSDTVIVQKLLDSYADLGIVPAVSSCPDTPTEVQRISRQRETDLRVIRRLATRNGYVFHLTPLAIGSTEAYWGPAMRRGIPQRALSVGSTDRDNLDAFNIGEDVLGPVKAKATIVDQDSRKDLAEPEVPPARIPLAARPIQPVRTVLLRDVANTGAVQAELASMAAATSAPEPVTASGEVDTVRYGDVLRARKLVGIRGAGTEHDGLWYVRRVTHTIERGSYRQSFELSRDGVGTLTAAVRS